MAHLNWHGKIVRVWKRIDGETRFHLTETGWLLKTSGPRMGGAKVYARPKETDKKNEAFQKLSNSTYWESTILDTLRQEGKENS